MHCISIFLDSRNSMDISKSIFTFQYQLVFKVFNALIKISKIWDAKLFLKQKYQSRTLEIYLYLEEIDVNLKVADFTLIYWYWHGREIYPHNLQFCEIEQGRKYIKDWIELLTPPGSSVNNGVLLIIEVLRYLSVSAH